MEVYFRTLQGKKEMLVVVDAHVSFRKLRRDLPKDCQRCYLWCRDGTYSGVLENACLSIVLGHEPFVWENIYSMMLPVRDEFRYPQTVPLVIDETWTEWRQLDWTCVSVLQGKSDWELYHTPWLLKRWEAGLSTFDDDIYLNVPVYPRNLFQELVHPSIVRREVKRYKRHMGEHELKMRFFGMYCLTQHVVGRKLLSYFYECEKHPSLVNDAWKVFQRLKKIYETTPREDPYREFIFVRNFSVVRLHGVFRHKPYMMINQYLSFYGMYVSIDFWNQYKTQIFRGVRYHYAKTIFPHLSDDDLVSLETHLEREMETVVSPSVYWIGKYHIQQLMTKSPFWTHIVSIWETLSRRNIYLWVEDSFYHAEYQLQIGNHLSDFLKKSSLTRQQKQEIQTMLRLRTITKK